MIDLQLPLSAEDVLTLQVGDILTLTGMIFTGRESFYLRAAQGILPPIDYDQVNVMMHVGPVLRSVREKWEPLGLTPTTSIRMEKECGPVLRQLGTRAIIGKGTMGQQTIEIMQREHAIHLCGIGIDSVNLVRRITHVQEVHFLEELGPTEATWVFAVQRLGPFVVDIDCHGRNLFDSIVKNTAQQLRGIYERRGVPQDFEYTPI